MKKSNSEKGHAKNIANAGLLITQIKELGEKYLPANQTILLENLEIIAQKATDQQAAVNNALPLYSNAVLQRQQYFKPLNRYISKLRKAYKAVYGITAEQVENFMTIARRIKGERKSKAKDATATQHSISQLSFDQRTNGVEMMIAHLKHTPDYNPNENEFKVETLANNHKEMLLKTKAVAETFAPLNTVRSKRDQALYTYKENLVDVFNSAKDYLFSILESNSYEYKAIGRIRFKKQ